MNRPARVQHVLLTVLLCGCVAAAEIPEVWLDVPFVKQEAEGCGAASIAMVMQYWFSIDGKASGDGADAAYILRSIHSHNGHGIYSSAMSQYLRRQGFSTFSFAGDWDVLQQHLRKGRPLIIALKPSAMDRSLHYVVVAGMDSQREIIMVNDPAERKLRQLDRTTFEKQWEGTQRWTLLALPQPVVH
jgi:ABC-type bacteriocin/lantibiotic exporter with double-glycine peptidase domain